MVVFISVNRVRVSSKKPIVLKLGLFAFTEFSKCTHHRKPATRSSILVKDMERSNT
ncbi:hypothetical protein KIN20_018580 [Parelaphostrongylus tenuis]|uniref:Uncharacterized protein n=1 Tax=Parelaphostrongylus tenuis TaxID=148309 RepID=A0AAD5N4E3_PARTN|nr:hypothetical protein KIN20_018580 [Parelaphostrongylus tenuis]